MEENRRKSIVNNENREYYQKTRTEIKNKKPQNAKQRHKVAKKASRKVKLQLALALISSILIGAGGTKLLNPGVEGVKENKNEIVVDLDETNKDLKIEGNRRQEFLERIAYETIEEQLETSTEQEINKLKTPEEVLEYIKEIYVSEFNKNNKEPITVDDVSFSKNKSDIVIYNDKAKNGDEILRYCSESRAKRNGIRIDGDKSVITAYNGQKTEKVAWNSNGEAQTVYLYTDQVEKDEKTTLQSVAEVVLAGIAMMDSMEQKNNNSWEVNREYKQRLIDAVKNYKNEQIEEIITGDTNIQQAQEDDGFEPGQ